MKTIFAVGGRHVGVEMCGARAHASCFIAGLEHELRRLGGHSEPPSTDAPQPDLIVRVWSGGGARSLGEQGRYHPTREYQADLFPVPEGTGLGSIVGWEPVEPSNEPCGTVPFPGVLAQELVRHLSPRA